MRAAKLSGKMKAEERRAQDAMKVAAQARALIARREEQEMQVAADRERRQFNYAIGVEAQARAQTWELDKMTLRSQADFARTERKRNEKLDQYDATIRYLDEHVDEFDAEMIEKLKFKAYMNLQGQTVSDRVLFPDEGDATDQLIAQMMKGRGVGVAPAGAGGATPELVPMLNPQGELKMVYAESVEEALASNWSHAPAGAEKTGSQFLSKAPTRFFPEVVEQEPQAIPETRLGLPGPRHSPAGDRFLTAQRYKYIQERFAQGYN